MTAPVRTWLLLSACSLMAVLAPCALAAEDLAATLQQRLQAAVSGGTMSGASVLVSSRSKIVAQVSAGTVGAQPQLTLSPDTVLWLASMSKPITATAIMMLREQGRLRLEDPVSRYIPEFGKRAMVRIARAAGDYELVPATRAITIRDLLTHTSGLQSIGVANPAIPEIAPGDTLAGWVAKLADVPLDFQPGSRWAYSNAVGFDVLSRIVEVVSGQPFEIFLQQRILDPLRMRDTGFRGRRIDLAKRVQPIAPQFAHDERLVGATFFSGAAGLFGTLEDYRHFAEMLAAGGVWQGARILRPESVATLSSNHVQTLFHSFNGRNDVAGMGFGYGVAVVLDPVAAGVSVPAGSFGWDGAGGTRFWVSPHEKRVTVLYVPDPKTRAEVESVVNRSVR
jgi:CubicO group peptidase (beta-lactamase class C family)